MTQKVVTIQLLGKEYTIGCPPGQQEQLRLCVEVLQERIKCTQKSAMLQNTENVLIMTALNMCHELLEAKALLALNNTDKTQ